MIYLDHNATTSALPAVVAAMAECEAQGLGNPASQHAPGRQARRVIEDAREAIADILGAKLDGPRPERLIFTSGGTEANNLALLGSAEALATAQPEQGRLAISAIEHPSIVESAARLAAQGWDVARLPVDAAGVVELAALDRLLDDPARTPRLVSVMLGNNETGVLQPVAELAAACNRVGVPLHTDAIQVVGKLPVDFRRLGAASLSFAAHKLHGPRGIGGLLVRHDAPLRPILFGGFQQGGLRPGTESTSLVVGLRVALESWRQESDARQTRLGELRRRLETALTSGWPGAVVHGQAAPRLPHCTCISFPGLDRQTLAMALDLAGIACSTGSACASGSSQPSPALLAMGLSPALIGSALRFSLGATTSAAEIEAAIPCILTICRASAAPGGTRQGPKLAKNQR